MQLSAFCSEMREFKVTVEKRLTAMEKDSHQCQLNPTVCANARRLEEHIKSDNSKLSRNTGIIACVISCVSFALVFFDRLLAGGK